MFEKIKNIFQKNPNIKLTSNAFINSTFNSTVLIFTIKPIDDFLLSLVVVIWFYSKEPFYA